MTSLTCDALAGRSLFAYGYMAKLLEGITDRNVVIEKKDCDYIKRLTDENVPIFFIDDSLHEATPVSLDSLETSFELQDSLLLPQ